MFASALGPQLAPAAGDASAAGCSAVEPGDAEADGAIVELPAGGAILRGPPGERVEVGLARYADASFPVSAGSFTGERSLVIPPDDSPVPWRAQLRASGPLELCELE